MSDVVVRSRAYVHVLLPTATGVTIYVICSAATLLIHQIPSIQRHFDIPASLHLGAGIAVFLNDFLLRLFGTSKLDTIVLSLFWTLIGLMVYLILKFIVNFFADIADDLTEKTSYMHPAQAEDHNELLQLVGRTAFRVVLFIVTIFYTVWVAGFFLHGSVSDATALGQWINSFPVLRQIALFLGECLALYILTILLRLVMLRARLSFP